jgi:hypothetical protein
VHAVLQAARALYLGLDAESAKSWGLNRAIFYQAAKNGYIGRFRRRRAHGRAAGAKAARKNYGVLYTVGGERAYAVKKGVGVRFVIGGKEQTPEMFDRQIRKRFPDWVLVWSEAYDLVESAPEPTLRLASRFHKDVYKRWRSLLAENWARGEAAFEGGLPAAA